MLGHFAVGAVLGDPSHTEVTVKLRPKAGGKEAIAEETARRVENEHLELGLGDGRSWGTREFRKPADHVIEVLDVVHQAAVGKSKTVIDGRAVVVELGGSYDL
jgi:hypothetical protein